jgi:hypothetical protein
VGPRAGLSAIEVVRRWEVDSRDSDGMLSLRRKLTAARHLRNTRRRTAQGVVFKRTGRR